MFPRYDPIAVSTTSRRRTFTAVFVVSVVASIVAVWLGLRYSGVITALVAGVAIGIVADTVLAVMQRRWRRRGPASHSAS